MANQKYKIGDSIFYANGRMHGSSVIDSIEGQFSNGNIVFYKYGIPYSYGNHKTWLREEDIFPDKESALERIKKLL